MRKSILQGVHFYRGVFPLHGGGKFPLMRRPWKAESHHRKAVLRPRSFFAERYGPFGSLVPQKTPSSPQLHAKAICNAINKSLMLIARCRCFMEANAESYFRSIFDLRRHDHFRSVCVLVVDTTSTFVNSPLDLFRSRKGRQDTAKSRTSRTIFFAWGVDSHLKRQFVSALFAIGIATDLIPVL